MGIGELGGLTNFGSNLGAGLADVLEIIISVVTVFVPIFLMMVAGFALLIFYQRARKYKYNVRILSDSSGELLESLDRGAIVQTSNGVMEFRLLKERKSLEVPARQLFILNEKKRKYTIMFHRVGEEDFFPIKVGLNKVTLKSMRDRILDRQDLPRPDNYVPLDPKTDLKAISFISMPLNPFSFATLKIKEVALKQQLQNKLLGYMPIIGAAVIGIVLLILAYLYFTATGNLTTEGGLCMQKATELINALKGSIRPSPIEGLPLPPI